MNKRFCVPGSAALSGALLLCATMLPGLASAAGAGRVLQVEGSVSLTRDKAVVNVKNETRLQSGDVLTTGSNGRVQWQTPDENISLLTPNSRYVIREYSYQGGSEGQSQNELLQGGLGTISGKIQSPGYKVVTPSADITVGGTKYKAVVCNGNCGGLPDGLYVAVTEGSVTVANGAGTLTGSAGQFIFAANRDSAPTLTDGQPGIFLTLSAYFEFEFDADRFADIIERPLSPS